MLQLVSILGISVTSESDKNILQYVLRGLKDKSKKFFIVTPNPEIVVYAQYHPQYKKLLNEAKVSLPDGVGLLLGGRVLGKPLISRFTGVDFIEKLCVESKDQPVSMGFLGGRNNVAEWTAKCLQEKYPWIKVAFVGEEWGEVGNSAWHVGGRNEKNVHATSSEQQAHIDILFVAFGFPKQEQWIAENLDKLPITAAMGVGGAFDFISGRVVRAPYIIRRFGLEWLFRLIIQPWRIKRQVALLVFVFLVMKEFFTKNRT